MAALYILDIVLILISIVLIVAVLMQQGQRQGLGAIGGGAETFFGKNKARSIDGKLQRITRIAVVVFVALAIIATIVSAHTMTARREAALNDIVEAAQEASEPVEEAAEGAAEAVDEAAEAVEEGAEAAAEAVEEGAEEAAEAVEGAVEEAGEAVEDAAEEAAQG